MAESFYINTELSKTEQYTQALSMLKILVEDESNKNANLYNVLAALKYGFNFFWVGFYWVDSTEELVLGPFQGPLACTRIKKGKGVCGTAWLNEETIVVPDVDAFSGHIACSSETKSEIVIPLIKNSKVIGVLDVDSEELNRFSTEDQVGLENIANWMKSLL